jgi:hypothetical protein
MAKIKKPPPHYFMEHLVERFREGRISVADFDALHDWLNSNPERTARSVVQKISQVHSGW